MSDTPAKPQTKIEILVDNHEHNDKPVKKGAVITVDEEIAGWLIHHKIGKKA